MVRLKLKKIIIIAVSLLLFSCKVDVPKVKGEQPNQQQSIKIGIIAALSGPAAGYGNSIVNGFKLAASEINKAGTLNIELIIEDSAGKQEQALSVVKKLINSDKVTAILGPTLSTEMRLVGPEANGNGIPILATSNTASGITGIGQFVFRDSMPESIAIPFAIKKAIEKYHIKNVAMLYGDDDVFTKSAFDTMKSTAEALGLNITTIEKFQKGQTDFKAQLTKIKSTSPDALLCSALYNEGGVILDQARKMGITVPVIGGNGFNSPKIFEIAGSSSDVLIVATPWFSESVENPKVLDFIGKFEKAYGSKPDQFAAQAYDGLFIMAHAIKTAASSDRNKIRDALASVRNFNGVLGKFSFDQNRDVDMEPFVLIAKDGKFQLLQ
ncbi:MAG: ABC transporter substrate-binding protein [Nitrospirae bacterium]|nr:ABC transporter substrate-binding protein [Nitrospirota bacterium]MBF0534841.1 ABC transporter substrate-binding protein [Nitrospirota bacterium]MBF0616756.1 ABC transporter substrate-binding protein [Nitrospirota bacterium]